MLSVIFSVAIGLFTIPVWEPITSGRQLLPTYWAAVIALTFSSLLQIVFNVCVDRDLIPLAYSVKFAVSELVLFDSDVACNYQFGKGE